MPDDHPLKKYFSERIEVLKTHLHQTHERFAEEDLHQLRVEIKKMNTLLRLLEVAVHEGYEKKKYDKILRKLFKPGGKLRESQRNIAQADEFELDGISRYREHLELKSEKHKQKLKDALLKFINARLVLFQSELEDFIVKTDSKNLNTTIIRFLKYEFQTITSIFPGIADAKTLHKARMHLKASGYILNLAMDLYHDENLQKLYDKVKISESLIGDWHDRVVFVKSLQKYADQELSPAQVHVLNSTADKVNLEIANAFDEIASTLALLVHDDFPDFNQKYPG